MKLSPLAGALDSADARVALRRVRLPPDAALRSVIPADTLADAPDDPPDGWVASGVWEWWSSLATRLHSGGFGAVRLVVEESGAFGFGRSRELEADLAVLREWVAREAGMPSSTGLFTLAWGMSGEAERAARGAAFSVADHLGLCLCALPDDLERLRTWWDTP